MKNSHCGRWFDSVVHLNEDLSFTLVTLFGYPFLEEPELRIQIAVGRGGVARHWDSDTSEFGGCERGRGDLDRWVASQCVTGECSIQAGAETDLVPWM